MSNKQLKIEELLERMGTQEPIGDPEHRYDLRRSLLCSRFFGNDTSCASRWDRMMTYTAPLVVGGMMVGAFTLMVIYSPTEADVGPQTTISKVVSVQAEEVSLIEAAPILLEDFLSDPSEPVVMLAGFETEQLVEPARFIPLSQQEYIRTQ